MASPLRNRISFQHFSHKGDYRKENQDCVAANNGLFVIADGMGGLNCGKRAAAIACVEIAQNSERLRGCDRLSIEVLDALFQSVNAELKRKISGSNFGTTASLLFISNDSFVVGSIGDTRIYLLRSGIAFQITEDQNLANENSSSFGKSILTNYLGASSLRGCSFSSGSLDDEDVFLLCSDGFYDAYDVVKMALKSKLNGQKLEIHEIEREAVRMDPKDNYSCALVRVSMPTVSKFEKK